MAFSFEERRPAKSFWEIIVVPITKRILQTVLILIEVALSRIITAAPIKPSCLLVPSHQCFFKK
jgi:hypothetical protein